MDLSFAKDSSRFSKAVEAIRKVGGAMTAEHIKEVYDSYDAPVVEEVKEEAATEEKPKKGKKK